MSFITKRERVFNEYDLYDLPGRNEGKLKAYASCTDARAWSHFCSDKSEHLVEIIKRNNEMCRTKYVPTEAIVNTLLAHKHAEIARLKRKIEEFEQMLTAYDELELTTDQKCEIAKAHASIKDANKDLNELWFDLNLSGFTGIDSDDFETGHSRGDEVVKYRDECNETPRSKGDEWSFVKEPIQTESKANQAAVQKCICDKGTHVEDPRIKELQEVIITKDAKLSALRNTNAVIENDVCEPYCIYAHIYTALEKIFGVLCQNDKYKLYLNLMTAGKDIRCIDIKGKILFKLKVLEKFSLALLAPCSQDFTSQSRNPDQDCSCYRAEVVADVEAAYALTSAETQIPGLDTKRAQLIADIMENEEMKEILNKDSAVFKSDLNEEKTKEDENVSYNVDQENLKRLKNLQESYDELMTCYEALKHENTCLQIRCQKYDELEKKFESVQSQLIEYNSLWSEKEHYRKRSLDLDSLKEQYMVLCEETTSLETQLKAATEINDVKSKTIEELRLDNIALEQRLNEASIAFEKERNSAHCKLKESECTIMCQGQQIKSLSIQIDRLLEQDPDKLQPKESEMPDIALIDEMNSLKEQIKNLQNALFCSEEEKQQLQEEYQNKLNLINDIKMEFEDVKNSYEAALQRNQYLEKYTDSFHEEVQKLVNENNVLSEGIQDKSNAIDNLINVIKNKSQEVNKLMEDIDAKSKENSDLYAEINSLKSSYNRSITVLDCEKTRVEQSLQLAKRESKELLEKVKDYDEQIQKQDQLSYLYQKQHEEYNKLQDLLTSAQEENKSLQINLTSHENKNLNLLEEIKKLQDINTLAVSNISSLQEENNNFKMSLELTKKDSRILEDELKNFKELSHQMQHLKESYEKLMEEKNQLKKDLDKKTLELDNANHDVNLTRKISEELEEKLKISEGLKDDLHKVDDSYKKLMMEQQRLQSELDEKKQSFIDLLKSYNNLKNDFKNMKDQRFEEIQGLSNELAALKHTYNELLAKKDALQMDCNTKTEENNELTLQLELLELNHKSVQKSMTTLQKEYLSIKNTLDALTRGSDELINRIKHYESLESEYEQLKQKHDQVKGEKSMLQKQLSIQIAELSQVSKDNQELKRESQHLLSHNEDLEKVLMNTRTQVMNDTSTEIITKDIIKEIEEMKKKKSDNDTKIRNLLDELDKSESVISELSEEILARDDKIAILENHINELQDEVRRLQSSLAEIVDTSEQIKENSFQKIRESLGAMEAHHSRATHNMKMELAKLQNENINLEERLSTSEFEKEDIFQEKHKYVSQISNLQNERVIIVTDIKQLEIKSVGDSALSPNNCTVEDILGSIDRIMRDIDTRRSKSTSLEETLLKVQNSYRLVQNKADEAKKIVEQEKQKIINEKEEAIRDRLNIERKLTELKEQLEKQVSNDINVIKDLEAEILNQKLIFDNLKNSTNNQISKLKEEMDSLRDLYQKALENISDLDKKLQLMSEEKKNNLAIIEQINDKLQQKIKEIDILNNELEKIKNKPRNSIGIQSLSVNTKDKKTQINKDFFHEGFDQKNDYNKIKNLGENKEFYQTKKQTVLEPIEKIATQKDKLIQPHEVQILTASVDPINKFDKNSYINHKLKNLAPGCLEQHSIPCTKEDNKEQDYKEIVIPIKEKSDMESMNLIDIYNKQSMHTNSSKIIDSNYLEKEIDIKSPALTSGITDFGFNTESCDTKNSSQKPSDLFGSVSGLSTDKGLFMIYADSEAHKSNEKKIWEPNDQSEEDNTSMKKDRSKNNSNGFTKDQEQKEDIVKRKLKINLPRVEIPSYNISDNVSDCDHKSIDSRTMSIYPSAGSLYASSQHQIKKERKLKNGRHDPTSGPPVSNTETQYSESQVYDKREKNPGIENKKQNRDKNYLSIPSASSEINKLSNENTDSKKMFENDSHHSLSRIDADVRLIKSKTDRSPTRRRIPDNKYGLDYILASVRRDPDNIKIYSAANSLRKTRSNELFDLVKLQEKSDSSPSRLSVLKDSSIDNKTTLNNNQPSFDSPTKTYTEQGVMVRLDPIEEYEKKIQNLMTALENTEKEYKKKIETIKVQYDSNIKSILNEHNEGVRSIQGLHEETLQDMIKHHDNEVENLRSMSIEAMRKADKLEKEVRSLKFKMPSSTCLNEEPTNISTSVIKKSVKSSENTKTLTRTNMQAFNVNPKTRYQGPCTCSLDINLSDTIRNIFEQVDADQKESAELTYLKYIANKILTKAVEDLDCEELSFLHLKVCRIWKVKSSKEEALQKKIGALEAELVNKQRFNQRDFTELDRKVAEEKRRLQEVRDAICRPMVRAESPGSETKNTSPVLHTTDAEYTPCTCKSAAGSLGLKEKRSAGDISPVTNVGVRPKLRPETSGRQAVMVKMGAIERREKKHYNDEPPTRLRRTQERRAYKK